MKYLVSVLLVLVSSCAFEIGSSSEELNSLKGESDTSIRENEVLKYKLPNDYLSTADNHNIYQYKCNCTIEEQRVRNDLICFKTVCRGDCDNCHYYDYVDFCITDTGH